MKRKKTNQRPAKPRPASAEQQGRSEGPTNVQRRAFLNTLQFGALGVIAVGGLGWFVASEVQANAREHDLSRIGNGIPAVVQIHDPQCPRCTALQREARDALDAFDSAELQYIVANIRTSEGRAFAGQHQVGHVTLLLFDGNGQRRRVLAGPNQAATLERAFRAHLAAEGAG